MKRFEYTTGEDFVETRFGFYLLDLLDHLKLPIPRVKDCILKKFHRKGLWGIKAFQLGREGEETIEIKVISETMEKGLNVIIQDIKGCLCGCYYKELAVTIPFSSKGMIKMLNPMNLIPTLVGKGFSMYPLFVAHPISHAPQKHFSGAPCPVRHKYMVGPASPTIG